MSKTDEREIFEQKPWLNDDEQNVEKLFQLLNNSGNGGAENGSSK